MILMKSFLCLYLTALLLRQINTFLKKTTPFALSSWGMVGSAAITAVGSVTSSAISKKKNSGGGGAVEGAMQDTRTPEQKQIDSFLANYVSKYGPLYEPGKNYSGDLSAPMGANEASGDKFLSQYLNASNITPNMQLARDYLTKSLNGGFDPGTSDFYKALRDEAAYNNRKAIDLSRQDMGSRGKYFSTESINKEGDINAQTAIGLNRDMASLADQERQRQQGAFENTAAFEDFISKIPLEKANAAQTVGSYGREVMQQDLERQYQDFVRQQTELGNVVNTARGVNTQPLTETFAAYPMQQQGGGLTNLIGPIVQQLLKTGISSYGGGGGGSTIGSSLLSSSGNSGSIIGSAGKSGANYGGGFFSNLY